MADVSGWVLVANSIVVGGFGLAGTFFVPRAQREARAAEQRALSDAVMRQKAEEIFAELIRVRESGNASMAAVTDMLAGRLPDPGVYDMVAFRALDRVISLLATYYPGALAIIDEGRGALKMRTDPIHARMMALPDGILSPDGSSLRIMMTNTVTTANADMVTSIERFMVGAVAAYVPTRPSA